MTQQTRQNDVAKSFFFTCLFVFKCEECLVAFYFSPSVRRVFFFCVVYWNNTALCQKEKKGVGILGLTFYLSI